MARECKRPGDWNISPDTYVYIDTLDRERSTRDQRVSGIKPTTDGRENSNFSEGDVVYYKSHHLPKASKGFHAGFAPKWWGPVKLAKQIGKGVFLTDQQPPRKIHVTILKHTHNSGSK